MGSMGLGKVITVFLLSTVKFLFAPGTAVASGFTVFEAILVTSLGGMTGITIFYFFGHWVFIKIDQMKERARRGKMKPKLIFTKRNRAIVKFKASFGLIGLVIVTPAILSIPIGSVVAAKFYFHNRLTYPLLLVSTLLWSIVLSAFAGQVKTFLFR